MEVKDIQARINKQVADQAQEDFKEAVHQCVKLLTPFFEPVKYTNEEERTAVCAAFNAGTKISAYGNVYICSDMDVPAAYVLMKQNEASAEFIERVKHLQEQVDDLYNQVQ